MSAVRSRAYSPHEPTYRRVKTTALPDAAIRHARTRVHDTDTTFVYSYIHSIKEERPLRKIAILGAGNMGTALIKGLAESAGPNDVEITVYDVDSARVHSLQERYGVESAQSTTSVVTDETEFLILAVKPQILPAVLGSLKDVLHENTLVISIAAGVTTDSMLALTGPQCKLIRSMPNAAAMIQRGVTAVCKAGAATDTDLEAAADLLSCVGPVVKVDEKLMNAVTALSGSGPGYIFVMMEAFTDGAVNLGLDRVTARKLTVQTFLGAASMATDESASFSELKDRITSPGGTTIAGIQVMEQAGLRGILMDVVEAAAMRGEELGEK